MFCLVCHQDLPESSFNPSTLNKSWRRCRACLRAYHKQWYRASPVRKEQLIEHNRRRKEAAAKYAVEYLLDHPCIDCGETDPVVLDFDHRDPQTKRLEVGAMINHSHSLATVMTEIEKCDVRCANCHRRRTATQFGFYRLRLVSSVAEQRSRKSQTEVRSLHEAPSCK